LYLLGKGGFYIDFDGFLFNHRLGSFCLLCKSFFQIELGLDFRLRTNSFPIENVRPHAFDTSSFPHH
jgi:hypothetical protein